MRWDSLRLDASQADGSPGSGAGAPALFERESVARTFDTPGFRGMTFYEVHARSIINQVPPASRMAFRWTINPYRGCSHSCSYCFARKSHIYLDMDSGHDFNSQIVVKVNAPQLARKELAAPKWQGEHVAMGTNVDCYQRAEGRYRLMPGIIEALRDAANPFSILTKGTLILRDLDLLAEAAEVTDVGLNVSVGFVDKEISRSVEPGTPSPERRLEVCAALNERGLRCGVLMGPVLPFLPTPPPSWSRPCGWTPRPVQLTSPRSCCTCGREPASGSCSGSARTSPTWSDAYRGMYGRSAYAPKAYQAQIAEQIRELARRYRVGRPPPGRHAASSREPPAAARAAARTAARAGAGPALLL